MSSLVVTGASGWMGKSAIAAWLREGHSAGSVRVISRKPGPLKVMGHEIMNFSSVEPCHLPGAVTLVHTAFVTREFYAQLGPEEFAKANRTIIQNAQNLIYSLKPKTLIFVNSGATQRIPIQSEVDPSYSAYVLLKKEEREVLSRTAEDIGAGVVEGVLFSATGQFMKDPLKFAFGSLLNQALLGQSVEIKSQGNVWRRYCDAEEFFDVLFHLADKGGSARVESGGELVELGDLVREIGIYLGKTILVGREVNPKIPDDFYFSTSNDYEIFLLEMGRTKISIQHQISNVLTALDLNGSY